MNYKTNIYDVIHIITPHINGALFDAFEYFMLNRKYYKKNRLFLIYNQNFVYKKKLLPKDIIEIFKDKYSIEENIFQEIIFLKNIFEIIKFKFKNILILDNHTYFYLDGLINFSNLYLLLDPFLPSKTDYKKLSLQKNIYIYNELLLHDYN